MTASARACYLSPPQVHVLRQAVSPLNEAFDATSYLVGSVLTRADFRDVDVRLILEDGDFQRLFGTEVDQFHGHATALWTSLVVTYSRDLSRQTGLNVDFQIQAASIANRDDGTRDALILPPAVPRLFPDQDGQGG